MLTIFSAEFIYFRTTNISDDLDFGLHAFGCTAYFVSFGEREICFTQESLSNFGIADLKHVRRPYHSSVS